MLNPPARPRDSGERTGAPARRPAAGVAAGACAQAADDRGCDGDRGARAAWLRARRDPRAPASGRVLRRDTPGDARAERGRRIPARHECEACSRHPGGSARPSRGRPPATSAARAGALPAADREPEVSARKRLRLTRPEGYRAFGIGALPRTRTWERGRPAHFNNRGPPAHCGRDARSDPPQCRFAGISGMRTVPSCAPSGE